MVHMTSHRFFRLTNYVKISVAVLSRALLMLAGFLNSGAGPNFDNKAFRPLRWKKSIKPYKLVQLRTANGEVVNFERIVPIFFRIGDLLVCVCSEIVANLEVDVLLGTSCMDWCICSILLAERKLVPCHSTPMAIISAKRRSIRFPPI